MKLSDDFWLSEFTKSQTALRNGIDNTPGPEEIKNLERLAVNVLQPARDRFGTIVISSGYRCLELNRKLGSRDTSQHIKGQAGDIESFNITNYDLAVWIRDNTDFDQVILELYDPEEGPNSGWVHVSYVSHEKNRKESLTYYRSGSFVLGLHR